MKVVVVMDVRFHMHLTSLTPLAHL